MMNSEEVTPDYDVVLTMLRAAFPLDGRRYPNTDFRVLARELHSRPWAVILGDALLGATFEENSLRALQEVISIVEYAQSLNKRRIALRES